MPQTKIPQIQTLNYNGEDIGMGFNRDTGLAVGTALDFTLPVGELAQESSGEVSIVTSHEDLMTKLHTSVEVGGRYYFLSGGGKVDYSNNTDYNTSSTFVLARSILQNTVQRGKEFILKPQFQHLHDTDPEAFNTAFGDSFVRAHFNGGEFYAMMRLTSTSSDTESKLATSLQLDLQGGVVAGSFKADLETAKSDKKNHTEFSVKFYQKGGTGANEIGTTLDVDEIKTRMKAFPDAVKNHPFPYVIEVADYNTVPLPTPPKEQLDDLLLTLADDETKKLRYIQGRNDCDFAAEHPEFFNDPPAAPVLRAVSSTYTQLFNAVIAHAIALSKGEIPPSLFDPSKLNPPIVEPALVLRKRDLLVEGNFVDLWASKDIPGIRKNDHDLILDIGNLAASQISAFETIVDPSGDPAKTARLQGEALARVVTSFREYSWDHAGVGFANRGPLNSLSLLPNLLPRTTKVLAFASNFPNSIGNAIRDCKGLELFPSLVTLDLSHNSISAIDELGTLKSLRELTSVDNGISDLGPLGNCTSLETLDISGNQVADLTPLAPCKALKNLTLFGTQVNSAGQATPSGNPITDILVLGSIPGLANPFTIGTVLSVRFGALKDGPAAQFTGTATRIGNSHAFRVHLSRGADVLDDVWSLRKISAVDGSVIAGFKLFFPTLIFGDIPISGSSLNIARASNNDNFEFNFSFVDPGNPSKCGIDLTKFPAFATTITLPTFDATVVS
jgi:Leucine-rich repeat (LRR) protein